MQSRFDNYSSRWNGAESVSRYGESSSAERPRLPQTFETTVLHPDSDSDLSWRFVIVPARSLRGEDIDLATAIQSLTLTNRRDIELSMLPFVIASMLSTTPDDNIMTKARDLFASFMQNPPLPDDATALRFAEQLAFDRVVPFEQSPLAAESLAAIASAGGDDRTGLALVKDGEQSFMLAGNRKGIVVAAPTQWFLSSSILERILDWLRGK